MSQPSPHAIRTAPLRTALLRMGALLRLEGGGNHRAPSLHARRAPCGEQL